MLRWAVARMPIKHDTCAALISAIDAYIAKADSDIERELKAAGYIDIDYTMKAVKRLEENLAEALNGETERACRELKKAKSIEEFMGGAFGAFQVRQASDDSPWGSFKDGSALGGSVSDTLQEEFERTIPKLVNDYLQTTDMGLAADTISQRTTSWIHTWSHDLGDLMQLTSHKEIEEILTRNLQEGLGVADATRDLMDAGIRSNYNRARSTALTEMLTAHSVSNQEAYMQSPAVEGKMWRHSGGRRNKVRPNHVDMDGEIVDKNKPFDLDGRDGWSYRPMYPRDTNLPASERVNCHCISQPVVNEETLGLPLDERRRLQQEAIDADDGSWLADLDRQNRERRDRQTILINPFKHKNTTTVQPEQVTVKPEPAPKPAEPTIAGVERGEAMTHEQADSGKVNPHFNSVEPGYRTNCQSSVVTYEARLRGYDVEVVPNDYHHPMCEKLASDTSMAYLPNNPDDLFVPYEISERWTWQDAWQGEKPTAKRFEKKLMGMLNEDARYTMEFKWRGCSSGHIVNLFKRDGKLMIYDPQSDKTLIGKEVSAYLNRIQYQRKWHGANFYTWPGVLRVDDKPFNFDVVNQIMQKAGSK